MLISMTRGPWIYFAYSFSWIYFDRFFFEGEGRCYKILILRFQDSSERLEKRHLEKKCENKLSGGTVRPGLNAVLHISRGGNNPVNHKNYNFLECDWFKKLLFSH